MHFYPPEWRCPLSQEQNDVSLINNVSAEIGNTVITIQVDNYHDGQELDLDSSESIA